MTKLDIIVNELKDLEQQGFWGEATIVFQNGKMTIFRKLSSKKLDEVKPNNGTPKGVFRERGCLPL